jgi:hypothetical protein
MKNIENEMTVDGDARPAPTGTEAGPTTTGRDARPTARWQELTGLTPEREEKMSADERDAAIRKLVAEVERQARLEFERTVFRDPLVRVCKSLGISRTKLSGYSRELTGLRAHELTDRIKAETLPAQVREWVERTLAPVLEDFATRVDRSRLDDDGYYIMWTRRVWRYVKAMRSGPSRRRWALELGYPNPSRLSRACLIAHGKSIDEMEFDHVQHVVQKFFEELLAERGTGFQPVKEHGQDARATGEPQAKPGFKAAAPLDPKQVGKQITEMLDMWRREGAGKKRLQERTRAG